MPIISDEEFETRIKALPDFAQQKIQEVERKQLQREGHVIAMAEQINRVRERRDEYAAQIGHAERQRQSKKHFSDKDNEQVAEWERRHDECKAEILRLQEESKQIPSSLSPEQLLEFVAELPIERVYEDVDDEHGNPKQKLVRKVFPKIGDARVTVTPRKGQTDNEALKEALDKLATLRSEHKSINAAQVPIEEADAAMVAEVSRRAAKGAPDFSGFFRQRGMRLPYSKPDESVPHFIFWAFRDQIIARAREELRRLHDPKRALSVNARRTRIAELDREILAQERVVEAWVERIEATGVTVNRNWSANMFAVLGIELVEDFG